MAFKGFNAETLAQMQKEGVPGETPGATEDIPKVDTPEGTQTDTKDGVLDIDIIDIPDTKDDADPPKDDKDSKDKDDNPDPGKAEAGKEVIDNNDEDAVTKTLTDKGLDPTALNARLVKDQGFTPEFIAELKEKLDPGLVDAYVADFNKEMETDDNKAKATDIKEKNKAVNDMNAFIFDSVGGEDKFKVMAGVLKDKAPSEALEVINAKLASGNKALVKEGMQDAVKQYKIATGRSDQRMTGDPNGDATPKFKFVTKEAYFSLMKTDKYKTDKTYAASVDADRIQSKQMDSKSTLPGQYRNVRNGQIYNM